MARHKKRTPSQGSTSRRETETLKNIVQATATTKWIAGPTDECKIQPGAWQPGRKAVVIDARPAIVLPEIFPKDVLEENADDEAATITETVEAAVAIEPDPEFGPDASLWTERPSFDDEPILFTHGPDPFEPVPPIPPIAVIAPAPYADYPFEDMVLLAEQLGDEETRIRNDCDLKDPDLRAIAILSADASVMTNVAFGDIDGAQAAAIEVMKDIADRLDALRDRLSKPVVVIERPLLTETEQRTAAVAYLGRTVARFTEKSIALCVSATELDSLARSAGTSYRRACQSLNETIASAQDSWRPLHMTILFHQAKEPDVAPETIAKFRSAAAVVLADAARLDASRKECAEAEQTLNETHDEWTRRRTAAQELQMRFQSARAACDAFEIGEEAFTATLDAGIETCDRALRDMNASASLIHLATPICPADIQRVEAQIPKITDLLTRLSQRSATELRSLMTVAYHVALNGRAKGRTPNVIAKMLHRGRLIDEAEIPSARDAIKPALETMFERSKRGTFTLYAPNDAGRIAAKDILAGRADADEIVEAIHEGRRIVNEEQQASKAEFAKKKQEERDATAEEDAEEEAS